MSYAHDPYISCSCCHGEMIWDKLSAEWFCDACGKTCTSHAISRALQREDEDRARHLRHAEEHRNDSKGPWPDGSTDALGTI